MSTPKFSQVYNSKCNILNKALTASEFKFGLLLRISKYVNNSLILPNFYQIYTIYLMSPQKIFIVSIPNQ